MATNQTTNYQLNQWEPTDQVLRTDFNADNAKVDAALASKANQTALDKLSGSLEDLSQRTDMLETQIVKCGTCKLESFSYVGTGDNVTTLQFTHKPLLFAIQGADGILWAGVSSGKSISVIQGINVYIGDSTVYWEGAQVSISGLNASYQMNEAGISYWVFAFYQED